MLRPMGVSIRKTFGEYRVTFTQAELRRRYPDRCGDASPVEVGRVAEAVACYESDLPSAVNTAYAMAIR
jgi:hypothetical protein